MKQIRAGLNSRAKSGPPQTRGSLCFEMDECQGERSVKFCQMTPPISAARAGFGRPSESAKAAADCRLFPQFRCAEVVEQGCANDRGSNLGDAALAARGYLLSDPGWI